MPSTKQNLKIDFCTHAAAKYACEHWHYSRCLPAGKIVKVGAWEDGKYIGCVLFSRGANNNAPKSFNVKVTECCELTRVALNKHKTPVSRILKIALKLLKNNSPGLKVIFSYADKTHQSHHGGIYQANGWLYLGERKTSDKGAYYLIRGKRMHGRSARAKYGHESKFPKPWKHLPSETKHLYVKIFDNEYELKHKVLPYPKRVDHESNGPRYHLG